MKKKLSKSPFTTETIYSIDYNKLENWIKDILSLKSFEIMELTNDTTNKFSISYKISREDYSVSEYYVKYELPDVLKIIEKEYCEEWELRTLFTYLWVEGYIEPGIYNIDISW